MTTKFDVGDELMLKVRVAAIYTDVSGTTYMLKILANNGENLAGTYLHYSQDTVEKVVLGNKLTTEEIEAEIYKALKLDPNFSPGGIFD